MRSNYIKKVAIVGAGGRMGKVIAEFLVKGGKHEVTAITRPDSTNVMPAGIHRTAHVNYDSRLSLTEALRGQQALIITMSVFAPKESQTRLIDAAIEAGVKYIMPNEWGIDLQNADLARDVLLGEPLLATRKYIEEKAAGKAHWLGMACGFWYEFSLAGTEARYGFDFEKKQLTLFDDGTAKIVTSTWPQVARAVASLLSLKIHPDNESDKSPTLSQFEDRSALVASFFVSQRDMFDSVLRVTGDSEQDWKVSYETSKERYQRGLKMKEEGNMVGFMMLLYTRVFYPDGSGAFRAKSDNEILGLPEEDFDEFTKLGIEMSKDGVDGPSH